MPIIDLPTPGGDEDVWGPKLNTAIGAINSALDAQDPSVLYALVDTVAALEARIDALEAAVAALSALDKAVLTNLYTGGAWPSRPTARTDVVVLWLGPSEPSTGMLANDLFLQV